MRTLVVVVGLVLLAGPASSKPATTGATAAQVKQAMPRLLVSLSQALVALEEQPVNAAAEKRADEVTRQGLMDLTKSGAVLFGHARGSSPGAEYYAQQIVADAARASLAFADDDRTTTKHLVWRVTDRCVACHARLPEKNKSPLAEILVPPARLAKFDELSRAHLLTATRRFEDAMDSYATYFARRNIEADVQVAHMKQYFKVALRVKDNHQHPQKVLKSFEGRNDIRPYVQAELAAWNRALQDVAKAKGADSIKKAKSFIKKGDAVVMHPWQREGLVYYVAASGVLHRLVENPKTPKKVRAEAYSLIVHADFRIDKEYPVVLAEDYLEAAIRTAPKTRIANDAYVLLERIMTLKHEPDAPTPLDQAEKKKLTELKKLTRL